MRLSESTVKLVLLEDKTNSPVFEQNRPITIRRPCECGCDNRGNPDLIGYVNGIKDGVGFTLELTDEETYQHLAKVFDGR